jgi:two-component system LytT family sensor kinase
MENRRFEMKLLDIFSVEEWDKLLGSFKTVVGIAPITFDAAGAPVTSPCFTCEACRMIKSTKEGARRCKEGHIAMVAEAKQTRKALVKFCHAKFLKVTIPIFDGDEFLGVTGGCNILAEDSQVDEAFYLRLGSEIGVDGAQLALEASKAKRVANSIIGMQIQTLVYRIRSKMIQIETRKRATAAV